MATIIKAPIATARLGELLRYDPSTGQLFWRVRATEDFSAPKYAKIWNTRYAGKEAGTVSKKDGYRYLHVDEHRVVAHRVVWALANAAWPVLALDHIDQDRLNNRLGNLREAGYAVNALNRLMKSDNTSGCTGVEQRPSGRWSAVIQVAGKRTYLGSFGSFEAAAHVRKQAQERLGFSPNHGRVRA